MKNQVCSLFNAAVHRRINAGMAAFALAGGMLVAGCSDQPESPPPTPPAAHAPQGPQSAREMQEKARTIFRKNPDSSRDLTAGETKLLQSLFGEAIDLTDVRIHFYNAAYKNYASMVIGGDTKNIYVFSKRYRSDDYSREEDGFLFGILVSEVTALWQEQTSMASTKGKADGDQYLLNAALKFSDYSPSLQSSIMEDYARRFFHPSHRGQWLAKYYGEDNCSADDFLSRVVERQFPAAGAAREALIKVEPLNENEKTLVSALFGDQINPSIVRKHFQPWGCTLLTGPGSIMATASSSRDINFLGSSNFSKDYSRDKDLNNFGTFVHEMTHIWQRQTGERMTNYRYVNKGNAYLYPLDTQKWQFPDYGVEQQAAIIEDYVRVFIRPERDPYWLDKDADLYEPLRVLVESQFPGAKKLREYYEVHHQLPGPGVGAAGVAPQPANSAQGPS